MVQEHTGISPELLEKCKELGKYFTIEIRRDYKRGAFEMKYIPIRPCPYVSQATLIDLLTGQVVWAHNTVFNIKGKISESRTNK